MGDKETNAVVGEWLNDCFYSDSDLWIVRIKMRGLVYF